MKYVLIFGVMISMLVFTGIVPITEAHPHATIDLMESHSHDIHDDKFKENFIVHSFEHVIISTLEWFQGILFIQ